MQKYLAKTEIKSSVKIPIDEKARPCKYKKWGVVATAAVDLCHSVRFINFTKPTLWAM